MSEQSRVLAETQVRTGPAAALELGTRASVEYSVQSKTSLGAC